MQHAVPPCGPARAGGHRCPSMSRDHVLAARARGCSHAANNRLVFWWSGRRLLRWRRWQQVIHYPRLLLLLLLLQASHQLLGCMLQGRREDSCQRRFS